MKITVELEDHAPDSLMLEHLAERDSSGHVDDYLFNLFWEKAYSHPDYRECPDRENCCELVYPKMIVEQQKHTNWKRYRITTEPCTVCPSCGGPLVKPELVPWNPTEMADKRDKAMESGGVRHDG